MILHVDILDTDSVSSAISDLERYITDLQERANTICERLASIGAVRASVLFSNAIYTGENDVQINVEPVENGWRINASGNAVLFIEYGAGDTYGYGHHEPEEYGPGTWPGKGHWNDPKGWYLPKSALGASHIHTYGNPPAEAMYTARQDILEMVEAVANEVLND